jgi:hypothetical protein
MTAIQLELPFMEDLNYRINTAMTPYKEEQAKSRRAVFAKVGEVKKEVDEVRHELFMLKQAMCQGKMEFALS